MRIILPALALALCAPLLAQEEPLPTEQAAEPEATIVIYRRGSVMGFGLGCPVRYQGRLVVDASPGNALRWKVKPGRYILENGTSSVELTVEAGETRYVRCQVKPGFLTGRADLQVVDGTEFEKKKAKLNVMG